MTAYAFTRLVHVLVAVLGMGSITAASLIRRGLTPIAFRSLIRIAGAATLLMIVSGMLLDHLSAGAFHEQTWFRLAVMATVAAGISVGFARRAVAQAIAGKSDTDRAMQRASRAMWLAFGLVIVIVVLMLRRPFA